MCRGASGRRWNDRDAWPDARTGLTRRELNNQHTPIPRGRPSILSDNSILQRDTCVRHLAVISPRLSFNLGLHRIGKASRDG